MSSPKLQVEGFFDANTWTLSYLVLDSSTNKCAIIDSVLDYEPNSGRTSTASADQLIARVQELGAQVEWLLETHVHADHLSAAPYLQQTVGGKIVIGEHISVVQKTFGKLFNAGTEFACDGSQFDQLLADADVLMIGNLKLTAMHTPGHTPACMTYVITDDTQTAAFVGDTLFMPDYGTARCDFPGGDARTLYQSIAKIFSLPDDTVLYMCHDYQPDGRQLQYISSVAEQRANNIHVHQGVSENEFVQLRETRDATLEMPVLILPSVQINMRAGHFPPAEDNGISYIKLPLNAL